MGEPLAGIFAAFDAFLKRSAEQRSAATRAMRDALTQRDGAAGVRGARQPNPRMADTPTPVSPSQPPAAAIARRPVSPARTEEAVLVAGLFSKPQTLAAAFIVAEVLAKPVALRDP